MSFALLAPLGLAALAALALPLLIHLVRRIELKTTEFAALRWIGERLRPQRRLRFERLWLLLLRLALVAALGLLLARPVWNGEAQPARGWIVVAPGVALADARAAASGAAAEWRWLSPGFPRIDETIAATDIPTASLLRELDAELPSGATLTVIVPEQLSGLDGERPHLTREVAWRVVPGRMQDATLAAQKPFQLAVRYAPDAEGSLRYLRAAVAAWNLRGPRRYELDAQPVDAPIGDATTALVWLAPSSSALTRWLDHGGTALAIRQTDADGEPLWRDANGDVLARNVAGGHGRLIALPGELNPQQVPILLDADFPDRLRAALGDEPPAPTHGPAAALRSRADTGSSAPSSDLPRTGHPLDSWLALLIAGLFLLERAVATHRQEPRA